MKKVLALIAAAAVGAALVFACTDRKSDELEKQKKEAEKFYRVPPPSDRSKDKGW